ncbi:MAG: ComEC/Rec2 family competence protein, partial [Oricola sp.]
VEVLKTERPTLRYAPAVVRVTAGGAADGFDIGDGIKGVVRLTSPSGPAFPGGYDFAFHGYFNGIGANGFFLGKPERAEIADRAGLFARSALAIEKLRHSISHEIRRAVPGREGAVATALITGSKSGIPDEVTEALRVSGLAHILSISGLHMALVAATVMATLRLGFAFFPLWSARYPVKKYAAAGALAATGFYLFLAGAGVATQRSFAMLAIMLLALSFDRAAVTMRNLALAALAVLAIAPNEVLGPGFQMSFAATAALIAVYGSWRDWTQYRPRRRRKPDRHVGIRSTLGTVGRYVLGILVTSFVAGLATGIFASYHFGRIAPYGLIANLAAMPVVSILVMPLAVVAVVLMPFGLHVYPFKAMAWAVGIVIDVAESVAALSPAVPTGQMPVVALLGLTAGLAILCLFSSRLRLLALPILLASGLLWHGQAPPLAVISEDARQFAVLSRDGDGTVRLHTNRDRPNGFILEQWSAAYRSGETVKPGRSNVMRCDGAICVATLGSEGRSRQVTYVDAVLDRDDPNTLESLCAGSDLVIFAKAPSPQACPDETPVLTAKMLALNGSAEIRFAGNGLSVRQASPGPTRPWLNHRRFSRAARNLEEWKPRASADQ